MQISSEICMCHRAIKQQCNAMNLAKKENKMAEGLIIFSDKQNIVSQFIMNAAFFC